MALNGLQVFGFVLGVLSWAGMIATCVSPEWRKHRRGQTIIDSTMRFDGLWGRCNAFESGQIHCEDYNPFFIGLRSDVQICRGLVISSVVSGFIAILTTVFGLKCVTIGSKSPSVKAWLALSGGLILAASGILIGAAVSFYAHSEVQQYYNPVLTQELPMHLRFEYGYGLFIGWACLVCAILSSVVIVTVSIVTLNQTTIKPQTNNNNLQPVTHQDGPQTTTIPLQTYSTTVNSVPPQRQDRLHADTTENPDSVYHNGSHRSFKNSYDSHHERSEHNGRRRRAERYSSGDCSSMQQRSNGKTSAQVHQPRTRDARRWSSDATPPRGLVRSVSGSLQQYL